MNFFEDYIYNNGGRPISKWKHYLNIYEKHFNTFRNKDISILEIGVGHGGSLQMWKNYFGKNCMVVGLDICEDCKNYEEDQIKIEIGDQFDLTTLNNLILKYKKFDIIIDDGSHINEHVIFTFNHLFKHLNEGGIYLVEDVHTAYYESHNGGLKKEGTFIEFVKNKIDEVNMFYNDYAGAEQNFITKHLNSICVYDSVVVFEKNFRKLKPHSIYSCGNFSNPVLNPSENLDLQP